MWVAKISFDGTGLGVGKNTLKSNIEYYVFPISWIYRKKEILVNFAGTVLGKEENKKIFFENLRKTKHIKNLERNSDFILGQAIEPLWAKTMYNENVFFISPIFPVVTKL